MRVYVRADTEFLTVGIGITAFVTEGHVMTCPGRCTMKECTGCFPNTTASLGLSPVQVLGDSIGLTRGSTTSRSVS